MTPFETELVGFIARFRWPPMRWQGRVVRDLVRTRDARQRGEAWAQRELTERERHCLYRLVWAKKDDLPPSLVIPVKEWLAAHGRPETRAEERASRRAERERTKDAKRAAEMARAPRLL